MISQELFFYGCVLILTALLYIPISRFIWVMSVRRLERKTKHQLSDEERTGQQRRARILALFLAVVFSLLFNISTLGFPQGG